MPSTLTHGFSWPSAMLVFRPMYRSAYGTETVLAPMAWKVMSMVFMPLVRIFRPLRSSGLVIGRVLLENWR